MIAVITEKPSLAQDIARVLGVTRKKDGYMEGNGYIIAWAYGPPVDLALPEEYGFEGKKTGDLPFIPEKFKLTPRKIRTAGGYQTDPGAVKQLRVIKTVFSRCDSIIAATEASGQGELLFRNMYNYLKCKKPFSRVWISSMTDKAIREGFENLKDGKDFDSLFLAARARSRADWVVEANAGRVLHICSGDTSHSPGRVQMPTLALVCKRYLDNRRFKVQPYWQTSLGLSRDGAGFRVTGTCHYFEKQAADKAFNAMKQSPEAKVLKYEREEKKIEAPLLHDLASLQKEANARHGFGAGMTLSIARKLYESKLVSYPGAGSRHIPEEVFETIPSLIDCLRSYPAFQKEAARLSGMELNRKPVDANKATGHHGLIITGNTPGGLSVEERSIYELIAGRMLEAFHQSGVNHCTRVEVCCNGLILCARQTTITHRGWRDIFNEREEYDKGESICLPVLTEGELLKVESINLLQKSTNPKPLYTEATLLAAMETAGRDSSGMEGKAASPGCGIGMPATRAGVIETLYEREYICLHNKSLVPTGKGMELYRQIAELQIADVELAGEWEAALLKIEEDPGSLASFHAGLKTFTRQAVTELASVIDKTGNCNQTPYICPKCRLGKIILWSKIAKCNYSKCGFRLYREICGKLLNDKAVRSLLLKRQTPLVKGFKDKEGKTFDARVVLGENGETEFKFPDNS